MYIKLFFVDKKNSRNPQLFKPCKINNHQYNIKKILNTNEHKHILIVLKGLAFLAWP